MFLWTDDNIIDTVFREQGGSIGCAGIYLFDLILTRPEIQTVRPDVTRITHNRPTARQEDRRIVNWRVQDRRSRRRCFFDGFSECDAVAIEFLILALACEQRKDIQRAGEDQ